MKSTENKAEPLNGIPISKYIRTEIGAAVPRHCKGMIAYASDEVASMEQTIADLRVRVEAMQKAGDAILDRLDIFSREYGSAQDERIFDELKAAWTTTPTPTDHGKSQNSCALRPNPYPPQTTPSNE
jgi:hypothetical protein